MQYGPHAPLNRISVRLLGNYPFAGVLTKQLHYLIPVISPVTPESPNEVQLAFVAPLDDGRSIDSEKFRYFRSGKQLTFFHPCHDHSSM